MVEVIDTPKIGKSIKHPGGGPICAPWRFDDKGELIILNPIRHDYNVNNYRLRNGFKSTCELCNRQVVWKHMKRHQNSNICMATKEKLNPQ